MHEIQLVPDFEYLWPKNISLLENISTCILTVKQTENQLRERKKFDRENFSSLPKTLTKGSLIAVHNL